MLVDRHTPPRIDDAPVTEGDEVCPHRRPPYVNRRRITLALHRSNSAPAIGRFAEAAILSSDRGGSVTR